MNLATRFKKARKEANLTQEELGNMASSSQDVVQKIENGKSLRPRNIEKFAKALGVNSSWLLFGNETTDTKLNSNERLIINKYRSLNSKDKNIVLRIIESLSSNV